MIGWGPNGVWGKRTANSLSLVVPSVSRRPRQVQTSPDKFAPTVRSGLAAPAGKAREELRAAVDALGKALNGYRIETRPVYSTSIQLAPAAPASVSGLSARLQAVSGSTSALQTTAGINTQTSTIRSSSGTIGLDVTSPQSASSIASTAEMNTGETTSYGSSTLNFGAAGQTSTSVGTLTGVYTGVNSAANAASLRIEITENVLALNSLIATNVRFEVRDQSNTLLFSYSGNIKAGDQVYLGDDIGLSLSFSIGGLTKGHYASTTVSHTPITVDTAAAFNNANADLRPKFDNGAQVTAGSFTVNGTLITVNANDTIDAVVARINASAAGVTAAVAGDRITLTTNSNSEDNITLANDTSGFLSAVKLFGASTGRGNVRDDLLSFSQTSQFRSVVNGSFKINGVAISINANTDTLSSVVERINSAGAGVTASYDGAADKLVFTPNTAGAALEIEDDGSGFLAAAQIAEGTAGTHVNAAAAFNAMGLSSPLFDPGLNVVAGSFTVNGVTITVAADDTVYSVLAKVTASDAGVGASYDDTAQTIRLISNRETSSPIAIGNDTSGFLAAVKLDETAQNITAATSLSPFDARFSRMTEYAGVGQGTLTVNGYQIAIDPAATTIRGLVSAIDGLVGVTATLDPDSGKIRILSEQSDTTLAISDTSGVLSALGIATGTFQGVRGFNGVVETQTGTTKTSNAAAVAESVAAAAEKLNAALLQVSRVAEGSSERGDLETAIRRVIDSLDDAGIRGLSISVGATDRRVTVDRNKVSSTLDDTLGGEAGPEAVLSRLTEKFEEQKAKLDGLPQAASPLEPPVVQVRDKIAELAQFRSSRTLLFLQSMFLAQKLAPSSFRKAMAEQWETEERKPGKA